MDINFCSVDGPERFCLHKL